MTASHPPSISPRHSAQDQLNSSILSAKDSREINHVSRFRRRTSDRTSRVTAPRALNHMFASARSTAPTQKVEATIDFMRVVSRRPKRIELRADVEYRDETLNAAGAVVKRTKQQSLKRTYILGWDNGRWLLLDFRPG